MSQLQMESIVQEQKIHFYEYMEVELLHQYIHSGILYLINAILNAYPSLIGLRYYSQQITTLLNMVKDAYFLITKNGLYAEYFYGLERSGKVSKVGVIKHLIVWFIIPYILKKVQAKYKNLKFEQENGVRIVGFQKYFLKIFPFLYALLGIVQTLMRLSYLIVKQTKYYNLQYLVTKVKTTYIQEEEETWKYPIFQLLKSPGLFLLLIGHKLLSFSYGRKKKQGENSKLTEIRAPLKEKKQRKCPICGRKAENPAFLKVSGYVFCYSCISSFVENEKACPITKIAVDESNIQIIYD